MTELSEEFWTQRYEDAQTGWDLGTISPPLKAYFDQLEDKSLKILIPGCGNGYEAEYLFKEGFKNTHVVDLSKNPLTNLKSRIPEFPEANMHHDDFFKHKGEYDLIVEQTMFCAIDPSLRSRYAKKAHSLLKPKGKLIGLMFNKEFEGGPPFGGDKQSYMDLFNPIFDKVVMEECYNSIAPRQGAELFVKFTKS